ncbi:hypothetical protein [Micromonospora chokoriensis]|uniref:hypothetical protein n=1 Tax=Micromonospora chokoriensis TaxID=356851 RepID=UPI0004C3A813|nr:hypothetical protein [Micromonospora chokoriensis]
MSRIEINAGGRHIIVDHTGELEPLRVAALSLFEATANVPGDEPGPAFGFQADRRWTPEVLPTSPGRYGSRTFEPVNASAEVDNPPPG